MGTRSSAVRKQPTEKPTPALPPVDPALAAALQPLVGKVEEGSLDPVAILSTVHGVLGSEKYPDFESKLSRYFAPDGIVEVYFATWDCGWRGKLQVLCGLVGAAAVLVGICEVAGRVLDVPGLQFGTKLAGLLLGD